jgi:hypothetical protein
MSALVEDGSLCYTAAPNMTESFFFFWENGSLLLIVGCRTLRRRKERGDKRK